MLKFSPKQNEYILKATHRWNLKTGAVRSGKSFVDVNFEILDRINSLRDKEGDILLLGVSQSTVERNVLNPMRRMYTDRLVGTVRSGTGVVYIAGCPVYCMGAEKSNQVGKIQGMSIKYCYGDEVAKWNVDVFEMLKSRLDREYSCFDGALNPEHPGHWLKKFIDRQDLDIYVQKYTLFDNPFLPEKVVRELCKEYENTVYYDRYVLGKWALAEGLIYPIYEKALAVPPEDSRTIEYCVSVDYGTQNAFAALLWELRPDGRWYATRLYYYSGRATGIPMDDGQYADAMDAWLADVLYIKSKVTHDNPLLAGMEGEPLDVIVDPSAASFITLLRKRQHYRVLSADNDVADGIRETASAINLGAIKVSPSCDQWIEEAQGYSWDPKAAEKEIEEPLKVNDHAMDAMRYFVKTKQIVRKWLEGS